MRRRRWLKRLAGVVVTLLLLEGGARFVFGVPPRHPYPQVPLTHHASRGFMPPASFRGWSLEAPVELNASGFRAPLATQCPSGAGRIVAVGDSMLFGQGVSREDTFSRRLSNDAFVYVNLGIPGFDLNQALTVLEEEGWAYQPREVHLHVVANDLMPNRGPDTFLRLTGEPRRERFEWLRASSLVVSSVRLWRGFRDPAHAFHRVLQETDGPEVSTDWITWTRPLHRALDRFEEICSRRGVRALVVVHPVPWQSSPAPRWQGLVTRACEQRGLPVLDVLPACDGSSWIDLDGHYSPHGHEQVARILRKALERH